VKMKRVPDENLGSSHSLEGGDKSCPGWQETFDAAIDIIALISSDYEILKLNKAGLEALGKTAEEFAGKKCYEVVHGLESPIEGCPCKKTLETNKAGAGELAEHGRNYVATASPIVNEKDKIIAFAHTIKDITELKAKEIELQEARKELERKVAARTAELIRANEQLENEVNERSQTEMALKESESNLKKQSAKLAQKNVALEEIIAHIGIDKLKIKEDIRDNLEQIVIPILEKMKKEGTTETYVKLLKHHLEALTSSFGLKLTERNVKLTPREFEICSMVKAALTNKDISKILNVSSHTVEWHRKRIRQKLGLANKGINLGTYLQRL